MSTKFVLADFVNAHGSEERKLRLFCTALVRAFETHYVPEIMDWCTLVENYYDGLPGKTVEQLRKIASAQEIIKYEGPFHFVRKDAKTAVTSTLAGVIIDTKDKVGVEKKAEELLKHLFPEPAPVFDWKPNENVLGTARRVYDEGDISDILADAIEEMGQESAHFRIGNHPKGCPHLDHAVGRE